MRDGRGNEIGLSGLMSAYTIECSCDLRSYSRESIVKQLAAIDLQSYCLTGRQRRLPPEIRATCYTTTQAKSSFIGPSDQANNAEDIVVK